MQLRRHHIAREVGGEDIGEAAAGGEEIALRAQVGQHVQQHGRQRQTGQQGDQQEAPSRFIVFFPVPALAGALISPQRIAAAAKSARKVA